MAVTADTTATTTENKASQTTQTTTEKTKVDLTRPEPVKPMGIEDDPNHKMAMLIKKRGAKAEEKKDETKTEAAKTEDKGAKTAETTEAKPVSGIGDLIAGALKFRVEKPKTEEKTETKTSESETKGAKTETKAEKAETKEAKEQKTIVTKKKAEPTQADFMRTAATAAAEAATAAVTAAMPRQSSPSSKATVPEDELPDDYRYEFEVAKHLAATNPKYKDAPQKILNEYARRSEYAKNWEARNEGKIFDPDDEEHNALEEALERPWSDHEFNRAAIQMEAKALSAQERSESDAKLKAIEEREAQRELSRVAQQTINSVAVMLAQNVDQAAHDLITKEPNGFAKLQENDPITAEALVEELDRLAPRIQTAIIVDDPQQRVSFDAKKNPDQKAWLDFLYEKEAAYAGTVDDSGKLFASRAEFVKLPPAQQARRWYLTPNHLISEMVADAVQNVKARVEKERERGKKFALALGYVPKTDTNGGSKADSSKADASKTTEEKKVETTNNDGAKPASPAAGGGGKIDTQNDAVLSGTAKVLGLLGNNLFGR